MFSLLSHLYREEIYLFGYLLFLFIVVPLVELTLLIHVGQFIGVMNTIAIVVLTGIAGASLARHQGFQVLQKITQSMQQGVLPSEALVDGVIILVCGFLLLTPGFLTDILGFAGLIPWTRGIVKTFVKRHIQGRMDSDNIISISSYHVHDVEWDREKDETSD